jgi:hypothetical protein
MLINTGSIAQNYKGWTTDTNLRKVRVKPKRSGSICKGFSMVEGYTYETEKLKGLKSKKRGA